MQEVRKGDAGSRAGKVDLHTHVLPGDLPDLAARYGSGGFPRLEHTRQGCARMTVDGKPFRDIDDRCWDPRRRLEDCDRAGVSLQVLSTIPVMFSYKAKPEHALDLSRLLNDHIAGLVREHPDRFAGLGTLPMQAPEMAVRELERCVKELGLSGVQIGTNVDAWELGDPALFPVFQRAEQLGACVFVHPWNMAGQERMGKYFLAWLVGMPAETALSICSMMFGGVFERLPRLRVCFAHGGGSLPATFGRVEHGFRARPDLCAVDNAKPPSAYLGKFYVDSLVHDAEALRFLIKRLGANRVALGSDYPFPLGEAEPGALIDSMSGLDAQTKRLLLSGTALEFLGKK